MPTEAELRLQCMVIVSVAGGVEGLLLIALNFSFFCFLGSLRYFMYRADFWCIDMIWYKHSKAGIQLVRRLNPYYYTVVTWYCPCLLASQPWLKGSEPRRCYYNGES